MRYQNLAINPDLHHRLRVRAAEGRTTIRALAEEALEGLLGAGGVQTPPEAIEGQDGASEAEEETVRVEMTPANVKGNPFTTSEG